MVSSMRGGDMNAARTLRRRGEKHQNNENGLGLGCPCRCAVNNLGPHVDSTQSSPVDFYPIQIPYGDFLRSS